MEIKWGTFVVHWGTFGDRDSKRGTIASSPWGTFGGWIGMRNNCTIKWGTFASYLGNMYGQRI